MSKKKPSFKHEMSGKKLYLQVCKRKTVTKTGVGLTVGWRPKQIEKKVKGQSNSYINMKESSARTKCWTETTICEEQFSVKLQSQA